MFKDYSFVFDIDGTLCPIKKKEEKYEDLVPYKEIIDKVRYYKENGARIILYTSRNMNTYKGNLGLINKHTAAILSEWLAKWDIIASMAHAKMLEKVGLFTADELALALGGLEKILQQVEDGKFEFKVDDEDIHFVFFERKGNKNV